MNQVLENLEMIGVGQASSLLVAARSGTFADAAKPVPMARTADSAEAETIL